MMAHSATSAGQRAQHITQKMGRFVAYLRVEVPIRWGVAAFVAPMLTAVMVAVLTKHQNVSTWLLTSQ